MTEVEQKRLYKHFKKLSVEGETEKQRTRCGQHAEEILKSFPQFKAEEKTNSKEVKGKK